MNVPYYLTLYEISTLQLHSHTIAVYTKISICMYEAIIIEHRKFARDSRISVEKLTFSSISRQKQYKALKWAIIITFHQKIVLTVNMNILG